MLSSVRDEGRSDCEAALFHLISFPLEKEEAPQLGLHLALTSPSGACRSRTPLEAHAADLLEANAAEGLALYRSQGDVHVLNLPRMVFAHEGEGSCEHFSRPEEEMDGNLHGGTV